MRKPGSDRAGTVGFGRFLGNRAVMPEAVFAAAADWPEAERSVLDLAPRKGRPARRATLALKYGTVEGRQTDETDNVGSGRAKSPPPRGSSPGMTLSGADDMRASYGLGTAP